MSILGEMFKSEADKLHLHMEKIEMVTNADFRSAVASELHGETLVNEMKYNEKGRTKTIYFRTGGNWYVFLYEKKKREIWFGHLGDPPGTGKLIIGFRQEVGK